MDPTGGGLRLASSVIAPLIKKLFHQDGPGAGLVDRPVRISALVSFRGETRTLGERELRRLSGELVDRATKAAGPHEAPTAEVREELTDALTRSLGDLGRLDMDDVQAVRLGPERLAARLAHPGDLSAAAGARYDGLLLATCVHILNFFTQRSTFVARTLVEQSRDLDLLIRKVDLLAERIPLQTAEDARFEERYLRYITDKHSTLTIYGIDLHQARDWPLDTAYLSLRTTERDAPHPVGESEAEESATPPSPPQPADRALAGRDRVLLRGEAGSGKTTLVQWLATTTARQEAADGMTHLLGRIPFVLPLRTLTRGGRDLPSPDAFLSAVGCPFHTAQPAGWIDRVLASRRGLLLIDGIDEIPEKDREPARRWLRELLHAYPGNLWLVTSRPSAVRDNWLAGDGFTDLALARMSRQDIAAFTDRWHRAARTEPALGERLQKAIRTQRDLGRLATNPLMCGLICALHRERRGYLPHGRKGLYDAALLMLLERRDRERGITGTRVELDAESMSLLLQKLAYWLIRNGQYEMERDIALDLVRRLLPAMPHVAGQGTAEEIFRHLLDRSGLLREPAPGTVDFVHRTFQDYLGAREAVEERDFGVLLRNAHLDQWEDIIRMAVAHARPDERAALLDSLVRRGDEEDRHRVRLHLLAMACLEQATQLDPAVRELVERRASALIPPRLESEANRLADLGPVVLELLPGPEGLSEQEARAVVITATRIGTDAAIPRLVPYCRHPSASVRSWLASEWSSFDTERYAREVLSQLSREGHYRIAASTPRELELLRELPDHRYYSLRGNFTADEVSRALAGKDVAEVHLFLGDRLYELGFLHRFPGLQRLLLSNVTGQDDLSTLAGLPISSLNLRGPGNAGDLGWMNELPHLSELYLWDDVIHGDLTALPARAALVQLSLPGYVEDLTAIAGWPTLRGLRLQERQTRMGSASWNAVAALPALSTLTVPAVGFSELTGTGLRFPAVTVLTADISDAPHRLPTVADSFPSLATLNLTGGRRAPVSLAPLAALPGLRRITCSDTIPVADADQLPPHISVLLHPPARY
ncbi:large ATP-binding protein [Streptomyces xiamenensis]|uniref:Large ATP-binding protein n=1 Tax=Streptomyces xiamenensis TaxID=408015 RepID=A0A0F7FTE7_9ACTN|nr:NACHT domain-containing protein [Streptomyces xiamenensis]AKG43658.1 large ATP-binding protein [Streptomyces xiamenensis]